MNALVRFSLPARLLAMLVAFVALGACGCDRSDPLSPAVQPEIVNNIDSTFSPA